MERTYRLTGTISELQELLQSQFDMDEEQAKCSICLLLMEQQPTVEALDEKQMALWYLGEQEKFTTAVLGSRFSISLTDTGKALLDQIITQFSSMLVDREKFAFSTVMSCLITLYRSATYIKDEECCVYYQALKWKSTHVTQDFFDVRSILPNEPDNVCAYLENIKEEKWKCYDCHDEKCGSSKERFINILDGLCERNVFKKRNEMYCFVR